MSIIFIESFDHYANATDLAKFWNTVTGSSIAFTTGRYGNCLACPNNANSANNAIKNFSNSSTVIVGFAFSTGSIPATSVFLRLRDSATTHLDLRIDTSKAILVTRNGTTLGTTTENLLENTWYYLELKATIHDTTGSYELRINGVSVLSGTDVDTRNGANAYVNQLSLGTPSLTGNAFIFKFDDVYLLDTSGSTNNDFLGDVRVDALFPTADGTYTQWTPSAGSDHYALVDETTPNTTDYVYDGTEGNKDSFVMSDMSELTSQVIFGVQIKVAALKDDAGSRSLKVGVRSNTTNALSDAQSLSTSQTYLTHVQETDPDTSLAWEPEAVDAIEALIETV